MSKEPMFMYDNENLVIQSGGTAGYCGIKMKENNKYDLFFLQAYLSHPIISDVMEKMGSDFEGGFYSRGTQVLEKLPIINVDFENMKQEDKDMYSRFIIELTPRLKEIGLITSVDVTAPDGGETWSMCFDRNVIGDVADYIVFMAYDEYGVSSTKPGTTAGYDWVKLSLNKFLQTEEIKSEKIILAIPFYTRVWTTNAEGKLISTNAVAMNKLNNIIPDGAEITWNDELKQNYVEYDDNGNKKQIWIEDLDSLKAKVSLINENNLAGVGSWKKDMELDEVWQMLKKELNIKK